jgi:hypothetical protein
MFEGFWMMKEYFLILCTVGTLGTGNGTVTVTKKKGVEVIFIYYSLFFFSKIGQ